MKAAPIRYHDGIETLSPDENAITAAHRPLGSLMRARPKTHQARSRLSPRAQPRAGGRACLDRQCAGLMSSTVS